MTSEKKDRYFAINTFGISAVEVLWGIGLPVIIESTFLQLFLKSLGASNKIIGLTPAIFSAGIAVFSLLAAYFTAHLVHKRRAVIITHILASIPFMLFGIVLYNIKNTPDTVTVFLMFYIAGALAMGLVIPIWQNFIVKIFSERNTIPAIAVMLLSQTGARLTGSLLTIKFVQLYAFSIESSALVFIFVGFLFFTGSFFYLFVKEINTSKDNTGKNAHNMKTLARAVIGIVSNRQYMLYLMGTIEAYTCITIISFYANYATEYFAIPAHLAAGLFLVCIHAAGGVIHIVLGWYNLLKFKNKVLISRMFALGAVVVLLNAHSLPGFLAASFMLGSSRAISSLCFFPAIKILSRAADATDYFSVSQVLILPLSFGIPFLSGLFLDRFSYLGAASYKILFGSCGILILVSLACVSMIDFESEQEPSCL